MKGIGFRAAFRGIGKALWWERNLRIELCAGGLALLLGLWTGLEAWGLCAILAFCGVVLSLEMVNTALETLGDRITHEPDLRIGVAKDLGAGAVLIAAICAALAAFALFCREEPLERLLRPESLILLLSLPAILWFVFGFGHRTRKKG